MLKQLMGILKWKLLMKRYRNMKPYTDEWWERMTSALAFLPENQRKGFMDVVVNAASSM